MKSFSRERLRLAACSARTFAASGDCRQVVNRSTVGGSLLTAS
jgi:hypothetical protein